jgi:hypothetical protein
MLNMSAAILCMLRRLADNPALGLTIAHRFHHCSLQALAASPRANANT